MTSFLTSPASPSTSFYHKRLGSDINERMARELQRQKAQEEAQRREIDRILSESDDLRKFKEKISSAYVSKERAGQIVDNQIKKLENIKRDAEMDDIMLSAEQQALERDRMRETERRIQRQIGSNMIRNQMEERRQQSLEAYQQFLREKEQVEMVVQKAIEDDLRAQRETRRKKEEVYKDMLQTFEMKREKEHKEKLIEEEEQRVYAEYMQKKDDRNAKLKAQRAEMEAAKEQVLSKMRAKEEERMQEKEWVDEMRHQIYAEEVDMRAVEREQRERDLRNMQRSQMIQAEQEAYYARVAREQEEARQEAEYKRELEETYMRNMEREKHLRQIKKQKDQEFKRDVEKLSFEKWQAYKQEREKELIEIKKKEDEERMKQELIRREKERLMREHLPYLEGFLSPSMVMSPKNMGSPLNMKKTKIY